MDSGDSLIDPEAEVRKLQDLVKKLEKQNEVLRSRQKNNSENVQNGEIEHGKLTLHHNNNIPDTLNLKNQPAESGDDSELVDIENLSMKDEEDSWLYSSPKPPTPLQNRVSPYKWVRKEFEHPSPEVESVKRSLVFKLDEAARMSRSCSTPVFGSYSTPKSYTKMSHSADSTPVYNNKPVIRKSLATYGSNIGMGKNVDTGTFTRPKRTRPQVNDMPSDPAKLPEETDSTDSKNHPNVSDIENLAKLQEESLRQSMSQSSPRRGERHLSQSNSLGSDASSPPDSPHASSQYLNNYNNNQENPGLRRSYQNVSRLPQTSGQYGSDPYLDNYSSGGSDEYEQTVSPKVRQYSRLQAPGRPGSPNVSGLRQPSPRGPSPQRTGLPTPSRRTIPRPGNSKLATPVRRSGLPAPRSASSSRHDDSWKEGCF
ncbi:SLAIN motif-containing protein 2-like isoform X2 [Mytilus californianus]|uniref:SLAIN motif-containing protein 2-like isoform X2 n=1 Tax=Mytilus californianus TaxID=6549 RepID=UPI0022466359|nr:SLAIN motif-containing protein 2-like isoform X2 [Mytilus californianus]